MRGGSAETVSTNRFTGQGCEETVSARVSLEAARMVGSGWFGVAPAGSLYETKQIFAVGDPWHPSWLA